MKIKVQGINERILYPDLWGNLNQEESERFGIKVKKLSLAVHSDKWIRASNFGKDQDTFPMDLTRYIQSHITGFINPIILEDEGKLIELDLEVLFDDKYEVLFPLVELLLAFIQDMYSEDDTEAVKK